MEVELNGGRTAGRGSEQHVTVVFGGPVDAEGRPVKIARAGEGLKG